MFTPFRLKFPKKHLNLKTKLIIIYFMTIFIPLMIISEFIISVSSNQVVRQTIEVSKDSSRQLKRNVMEVLQQYINLSERICFDKTLGSYLEPGRVYGNVVESIEAYENYLRPIIYFDVYLKTKQQSLKIYYFNKTLIQDAFTYIFIDEEIEKMNIFKKAVGANGALVWVIEDRKAFIARLVQDIQGTKVAVVSVEIPQEMISSLIMESNKEERLIFISDNKGEIISTNDLNYPGSTIGKENFFATVAGKTSGIFDYSDGENYKAIYDTVEATIHFPEWKIITLIPIENLLKNVVIIRNIGILVSFLCLTASTLVFLVFLNKITSRIEALVEKMKRVKNGTFSKVEDEGDYDEVGIMTKNFNIMVESLEKLIYENYEVNLKIKDIELMKREAELYALQSQINPHFLFNTLESIRMVLHNKGDSETSGIVLILSKILRRSLNWSGEIVTISDEIEFVKDYLSIQKYRYKEKINYSIIISEDILKLNIPKLIIQPIVENSIKHGLEKKWGSGKVEISAVENGNNITILIQDDGVGIDGKSLDEIRAGLSDAENIKKSGSIGIRNVNDRIILHYGPKYGVKLESTVNVGTSVTLELPVERTEVLKA